jgi:ribonuclease HII
MSLKIQFSEYPLECGTDEAGRGCLAGPVVAAAVILPSSFTNDLLNDSKQVSKTNRYELRTIIEEAAICYKVAFVNEARIDKTNILKASIQAMHLAIEGLAPQPEFISVDGNKFIPYNKVPYQTIVKGDSKFLNIAAASILAKTYRDDYMEELHRSFPQYQWNKNKGYPTKAHREAIKTHGITRHHRRSFNLLPKQFRLAL